MLERRQFVYTSENVEILNPTKSHINEIRKRIEEAKAKENYNDIILTKILMEELVSPINPEYNFAEYSLEEIEELLDEEHYTQYEEIPNIIHNLSIILSEIIISEYQQALIDVKKIELELIQGELGESVDKILEKVKKVENEKKRLDNEKRIEDVLKTRKWHKGNKRGR